jgi:hypothetical protein
MPVSDTSEASGETGLHPYDLLRRAVHSAQRDREELERSLAEEWCAAESGMLFADSGLPTGETIGRSDNCVGVARSHNTLYAAADVLDDVTNLRESHRSRAFLVERAWGPPVASWYLRLHRAALHDPFGGLVRVEISAERPGGTSALSTQADHISEWILAERTPLSLPGARWAATVYGVRSVELFLNSWSG